EGIHQERHDTWRERACLLSLSFAKGIGNTLERLMLASRIVAQRVSYARTFSPRKIKGLPVADVCRTAVGIAPLSPIAHRRASVNRETSAQGEHGTKTPEFFVRSVAACAAHHAPAGGAWRCPMPPVRSAAAGVCRLCCSSRRPVSMPSHPAPDEAR